MPARVNLARAFTRVVVVAVVLASAVLHANPATAVAVGTLASLGQYPFAIRPTMTHIPRPDGTFYNSACSAALISPTRIITAGLCFHDADRVPVSGPVPHATTAALNTVPEIQHARDDHRFDVVDLLFPAQGETRDVVEVQQSATTDIALARIAEPVVDPALVSVESSCPDCPHAGAETTARVDTEHMWISTIVPDLP